MIERAQPRASANVRATEGGNYFTTPKDDVDFFSSGCKTFDLALGGGWAERRIANIIGDKSTGKTLLCIEAMTNFAIKYPMKGRQGRIRYRETEAAFNEKYAEALGLPLNRVDFGGDAPMETVEDLFEELEHRCKIAKHPELMIVDSLDALSSRAERERGIDEGSYGGEKAKKMSELFRRQAAAMADKNITMIIVSQVRDKINVKFGRKWTRSGGRALDFYASQVPVLAQIGKVPRTIGGITRTIGIQIKAILDKNKVGLAFREAEFDIMFGFGIDDFKSCMEFLKKVKHEQDALDNMKPESFNQFMRTASDEDYHRNMARIHAAVEHRWYEVERSFLPKRSKYRGV